MWVIYSCEILCITEANNAEQCWGWICWGTSPLMCFACSDPCDGSAWVRAPPVSTLNITVPLASAIMAFSWQPTALHVTEPILTFSFWKLAADGIFIPPKTCSFFDEMIQKLDFSHWKLFLLVMPPCCVCAVLTTGFCEGILWHCFLTFGYACTRNRGGWKTEAFSMFFLVTLQDLLISFKTRLRLLSS